MLSTGQDNHQHHPSSFSFDVLHDHSLLPHHNDVTLKVDHQVSDHSHLHQSSNSANNSQMNNNNINNINRMINNNNSNNNNNNSNIHNQNHINHIISSSTNLHNINLNNATHQSQNLNQSNDLKFEDLRSLVRLLGFVSADQWRQFTLSGAAPSSFPAHPDVIFADQWNGWDDFLMEGSVQGRMASNSSGLTGMVGLSSLSSTLQQTTTDDEKLLKDALAQHDIAATLEKQQSHHSSPLYLNFIEARKLVHLLHLRSRADYIRYCKLPQRITVLPADPDIVYRDVGWKSYSDWLGIRRREGYQVKMFRPFEEAQDFARSLNLTTHRNWEIFCRSGTRPDDIPSRPDQVYGCHGWQGWCSWLRSEPPKSERTTITRCFRPFEEARAFARSLDLGAHKKWEEFCRAPGQRPKDIPSRPDRVYALHGWQGWSNWLGNSNECKGGNRTRFKPTMSSSNTPTTFIPASHATHNPKQPKAHKGNKDSFSEPLLVGLDSNVSLPIHSATSFTLPEFGEEEMDACMNNDHHSGHNSMEFSH